jgi:hypothetical protein
LAETVRWQRLRRYGAYALMAVGALGIIDVPHQISEWADLLGPISGRIAWGLLFLVGLALLFAPTIERRLDKPKLRRRQPRVRGEDLATPLEKVKRRRLGVSPPLHRTGGYPTSDRQLPVPSQPHPIRKVLDPAHRAPAALEQQCRFGQALRDWLAAGGDPQAEPQPKQEHTALIRMRSPASPAESVEMWVNETDAVLKQQAPAEGARFLDDEGLPPGTDPISILDRRIYRLEEIVNDLRAKA